jgi:hypothetical protein
MTTTSGPKAGPSKGISESEWFAYNRTGATLKVGDFCMFDETGANAETEAATGGPLGNLIVPTTAGLGADGGDVGYRACVVVDLLDKFDGTTPGADNELVRVRVRGFVKVAITAAQNIAFGDLLSGVNAVHTMSENATQFVKIYARANEEIASAVAGTLYEVHLEGLTGFGRWDT